MSWSVQAASYPWCWEGPCAYPRVPCRSSSRIHHDACAWRVCGQSCEDEQMGCTSSCCARRCPALGHKTSKQCVPNNKEQSRSITFAARKEDCIQAGNAGKQEACHPTAEHSYKSEQHTTIVSTKATPYTQSRHYAQCTYLL